MPEPTITREEVRAWLESMARPAIIVVGDVVPVVDTARAAARLRLALAALEDAERMDAQEDGTVEVQPMGTTVPYFNVVTPDGRLYTTADGTSLRAAIDRARGTVTDGA